MGYILKLVHGGDELDLTTGRFAPRPDFAPPATQFTVSTLRSGLGERLVEQRPENRVFTFSLRVKGSSVSEVSAGIGQVQAFLRRAGNPSQPLYLAYRDYNDYTFEPTWGEFGAFYLYEIVAGTVEPSGQYNLAYLSNTDPEAIFTLTLRPLARKRPMLAGSATGSILIDRYGTGGGFPRGIMVPEATTNKMTNPVFGHPTYNNGWTAEAGIVKSECNDERYILFGYASAKLTALTSGTKTYTQSINVGNTNTHYFSAYVKLPDGSAVSSTHMNIRYGASNLTTTFVSLGNGWYIAYATTAGVASATNSGILVNAGYTVYLAGFQLEEKAYPTWLCHGDMLDASWAGTVHASTSTRTAARWRLPVASPGTAERAGGTVRIVWRPGLASTLTTAKYVIWRVGTGSSRLDIQYDKSTNQYQITDGTTTQSASATLTVHTPEVLHLAYSAASMILYRNGVALATLSSYAVTNLSGYTYVGSDDSAASQSGGTFMDYAIFDRALTAAQVLADYNQVYQQAADDEQVGAMPWLWTDDGDDVIDSGNDGTREMHAVVGSVPGGLPTSPRLDGTITNGASTLDLIIANLHLREHLPWQGSLYYEGSGTAATSAESNSDTTTISSVGTSAATVGSISWSSARRFDWRLIDGKDFHILARLKNAGAGLRVAVNYGIRGSVTGATGSYRAANSVGNSKFYAVLSHPLAFPNARDLGLGDPLRWLAPMNFVIMLYGKNVTSSGNITLDYWVALPRPLTYVPLQSLSGGNSGDFILDGRQFVGYSSGRTYSNGRITGDSLTVYPRRYNVLICAACTHNGDFNSVANTLTFNSLRVTPQYEVF